MGRHNLVTVHTPSVAEAVHSASSSLFSFVPPPAIPPGAILNEIVELVWEIAVVSHSVKSQRRQELVDFAKHTKQLVDPVVNALQNEHISQQAGVVKNLEELRSVLKRISHAISSANGPESSRQRIRHALCPEEDPANVARLRQLLDDALKVFHFTATCEMLSRPCSRPLTPWGDQPAGYPDPPRPSEPHGSNELAAASLEVGRLRSLFRRNRRPPIAWQLAASLKHYCGLLIASGRPIEALVICQEYAGLYESLAERGKGIYYDSDGHCTARTSEEIYEGDWGC